MQTDYAVFANEDTERINKADAGAFYMEGYNAAIKEQSSDLTKLREENKVFNVFRGAVSLFLLNEREADQAIFCIGTESYTPRLIYLTIDLTVRNNPELKKKHSILYENHKLREALTEIVNLCDYLKIEESQPFLEIRNAKQLLTAKTDK